MKKILTAILLTACLSLVACNSNDTTTEKKSENNTSQAELFKGDYVVSADYVKDNLNDITLIDARGEKAAKKESVKGAIPLDWQYLATTETGEPGDENWGCILDKEELGKRLSEKGVSMDKAVVLFASADQGWGEDGRIAWELMASGYKDVKIVDGGYNAIKLAGVETQKGQTDIKPANVKIDSIDNSGTINTEELKKDYDKYKIIDVREKDEYDGATKYGEKNGGHLPGAININFTSLFNEDGYLKSNDELKKIFKEKGIEPSDNVVTYCTAGIRSAHMKLVLNMLGYDNVKNYDESFYRWSAVEKLEK